MRDEKPFSKGRIEIESDVPLGDGLIRIPKAEWQKLIDRIAALERDIHGKGDSETFKSAEWE